MTSQSDSRNIGYNNSRTITLVADSVSNEEMEILSSLFLSPSVYLYNGSGGDDDFDKSWLMVTVKGDGIIKQTKKHSRKVTVEVTLPEFYTQTLK